MEQLRKLGDEKVVILENGKNPKIEDNIKRRPSLCFLSRLCPSDEQSTAPRAERCENDKQQKPPIPPTIKHIARHHDKSVLQTQLPLRLADEAVEDEPIEQEHYRKKYRELEGIEQHDGHII